MSAESTSPDYVGLTRGTFEAVNRRDFDAVVALFAPNMVWDMSPVGLGEYKDAMAIRALWEDWIGAYEEYEIEPAEILDLGGGIILAVIHQSGRPAGSSGHVQLHYATVCEWTAGLLARVTNYTDIADARAVAEGLARERR
jgi:ketosteroid isomerase-like protein